MDKRETIEFLKKSLGEIPHLAKLVPYNHDYSLWHKVIEGILEQVFGRDSFEYKEFSKAFVRISTGNSKKDYLWELKKRETAILAIIQKHEILGVREEQEASARAEIEEKPPIGFRPPHKEKNG